MPRWEWRIYATLGVLAGLEAANLLRLDQGQLASVMLAIYLFFLAMTIMRPVIVPVPGRHRKE